ncbi:MAG: hypothetical protein JWM57_365 [Phycisphaerales bacterium]|nr:hypothetical protein [Phycisphaerales bacterium]
MSVRDLFEKHKTAVSVVACIAVAAGVIAVVMQMSSQFGSPVPQGSFYTVDDGVTYFAEREVRIPPFDYNGKPAVRAHVGRQSDGKLKVFYVERLKPDARAAVVKLRANQPTTNAEMEALAKGVEVKVPGEEKWRTFADPAGKSMWVQSLVGADKKVPEYVNE